MPDQPFPPVSPRVGIGPMRPAFLAMVGLLALTLVGLTGCGGVRGIGLTDWARNGFKVGPNYCRPGAEVADEWIDFNNPQVISDSAGVDNSEWWQSLGDPQIDELVRVSYSENLPLRVAGLRVLEARTQRAIVVGELFPQSQTAFGSYQRIQLSRSGNSFGVAPVGKRAFDLWNTGLSMSWEFGHLGPFPPRDRVGRRKRRRVDRRL